MGTIDANETRATDSAREDDASREELPERGVNGSEGLAEMQTNLAGRELPSGMGAEDPEDPHLGSRPQDAFEHASAMKAGVIYRFFDCMYDFSNPGQTRCLPIRRYRHRPPWPGRRPSYFVLAEGVRVTEIVHRSQGYRGLD